MGKAFSRPLLPYRTGYIEVDDGHGGRTYKSLSPTSASSNSSIPEEPTINEMDELNAIVNILLGGEADAGNGPDEESETNAG